MIKILDLYIGRTIIMTSAIVLLVVVGMNAILSYVGELPQVGRGTYDLLDAAIYILYSQPRALEMFFPMAVLLGALIGMGLLASNSELVVMQAAGLSRSNIIFSAMKTAIPMVLLVMAIGEWVTPVAEQTGKEMRVHSLTGGSVLSAGEGIWTKDGNDFIRIRSVIEGDQLERITLFRFERGLDLHEILYAKRGIYNGDGWVLEDVHRLSINTDRIAASTEAQWIWHSALTPDKLGVVSVKPESLSLQGLWAYVDYLEHSQQDASRYALAFWRKAVTPLNVAVMLLLALSFVFGPLRSVTMGARIIMGVIAGFSFYVAEQVFGPIALVYQLPAWLGAGMPALLFLMVATFLLRRS